MRRFRFHIGTLVILILVLGVGFAALRESNEIWDSGVFTLTVAALLASVLLAIHRSAKQRAFWVGFALVGTTYLWLELVPSLEHRLITTKALAFIGSKLPRSVPAGFEYFDYDNDGRMDLYVVNNSRSNAVYASKGNGKFVDVTTTAGLNLGSNDILLVNNSAGLWLVGTTENFMRIGHSLMALFAAMIGGLVSRRLYDKNRRPVHIPDR
jgi:hypothetical protein